MSEAAAAVQPDSEATGGGVDVKDSFSAERRKIQSSFQLFAVKNREDLIPVEEVGTIMRYLGAFPSEEQVVTEILPQIQDDELVTHVKYDRFERMMLRILAEQEYEPDSEEVLMQAFRILDPEEKGYLTEERMVELLTSNEWAFREKEIKDFLSVARDHESGFMKYAEYVEIMNEGSVSGLGW